MDKFGVPAESVVCKKCKGSGRIKLGIKQYVICSECNGEGRTRDVNPVKEAEEIKKQIEDNYGK